MDKSLLDIEQFNYPLDPAKIAHYPLPRGESKLLIYEQGSIRESQYKHIDQALDERTWLIFNETKVVQARLLFPKNEQSIIEIFCLEPAEKLSVEEAMQRTGSIEYWCLVGGARKWKDHDLKMPLGDIEVRAEKLGREGADFKVRLSWNGDLSFSELLDLAGKTPLPPYIKRQAEEADKTTYQTVYASRAGSVAAPTAGLHFNEAIFEKMAAKGIERNFLTLHVGAGTFKPVSTSVEEHEMHAEELFLERGFAQRTLNALEQGKKIIPVGTTSLRALESMYWLGAMLQAGRDFPVGEDILVPQWIAFDGEIEPCSPADSFKALLNLLDTRGKDWLNLKTQLIIAPGYQHRIIQGLITNFHQPKSTLMLLVSSLIGEDWRKVYQYALDHDFRFLSYGDGCLLMP